MSRDRIELEGKVTDASRDKFKVDVGNSVIVLCTLSGKIRMCKPPIRILVGDSVKIEVSEYDTTQGRIIYRYKK